MTTNQRKPIQQATAQPLTYRGTPHKPNVPMLDVASVWLAYGSIGGAINRAKEAVYALEEVSFQAETGEQIAIIGPNGAGKSTLLKIVAGILRPDKGSVEMYGYAPDKHICIAYVPQRSEIDWQFPVTVSDVVLMGRTKQIGLFRRASKQDHAIVRTSLERVQAADLANKQIGELSGGQQQRVFIARALAMNATILLMDEPLSGLDIPSQEAILDILAGLRAEEVTVLLATHNLGMAANKFDRIMLLNKRIVALGDSERVLSAENLLAAYGGNMTVQTNGHTLSGAS